MKIGRILGIVAGILTVVGVFLPWISVKDLAGNVTDYSGIAVPLTFFGMMTLIFGLLGLIFVAIGKRGLCIAGLVMGIIAMLFVLIIFAIMTTVLAVGAGSVFSMGIGLIISMVGSILLIIGCAIAFAQAGKKAAPAPPIAPTPPPMQ